MIKRIFEVVGSSDVIRDTLEKSFTIYHCVGEAFYSSTQGSEVAKVFCGLGEYQIGDKLECINHKNDIIVLRKI